MKFTGPVYRPQVEADGLLLQVTVGCTHNKCTFCTMYKDTSFSVEPIELIDTDDLVYYRRHIINTIPFDCYLPSNKEKVLAYIDKKVAAIDEAYLNSIPKRHTIKFKSFR